MKEPVILVYNPGSTSSKVALFEGEKMLWQENIHHSSEELANFDRIADQKDFRKELMEKVIKEHGVGTSEISVVIARGGLVRPVESGVWRVNQKMVDELLSEKRGGHASNLGAVVAYSLANDWGIEAWMADPPVVDEMEEIAKISGMPEIKRKSIFHALNQKAVARRYAEKVGKEYESLRLIVVHIGGGISVGIHKGGRVVDVNNAFDGDGPFSPERAGGLPVGELVKLCFSGKYTYNDVIEKLTRKGGLVAYLGTNNMKEVRERIANGDDYARLICDAMIYQIGKEVGAAAAVLEGDVDAIIVTGGLAYDKDTVEALKEMVRFIAGVVVYPGEDEMAALASAALRVLRGEEKVKEY